MRLEGFSAAPRKGNDNMAERVYWLWLANRPNVGARAVTELLEFYGDPEAVFSAGRGSLIQRGFLTAGQVDALSDKNLDGADRLIEECAKKNIHILTLGDSGYPSRLKHIYNPPLVLYWRGKQPAWDARPMISIVGSRRTSYYSRTMAGRFAASLAESGFLIVSGMASGIDGEANRAAMVTGGGTIAVLGCGVDICYPHSNEWLYRDLHTAGTILSEYPPGAEPEGWHFPQRNRIISGLSVASIIIGAPKKSGALITARLALDQGRDVYAVPGRLDDRLSEGCNALIRDSGAVLLTDPIQIIHRYGNLLRNPPNERWIERVFRGQTGVYTQEPRPSPQNDEAKKRQAESAPQAERASQATAVPSLSESEPQAEEMTLRAVNDPQLETAVSPPESGPQSEIAVSPPESDPWAETAASQAGGSSRTKGDAQLEGYSLNERRIIEAVRMGAQSTDRLIEATGIPAAQLLSLVTILELDGLLRNEGGMITLLKI